MKLGDVCTIRYGRDHKGLKDGPVPVYGSGGVMRHVERALYDKPSVLIPRKGSLNNLFYIDMPFWTVDTLFWTDIDESKVIPHYLYYALKTKNLSELNVGTAVPSLTTEVLNAVELDIPDILTQTQVVRILEAFDAQVALNQRTNDYLAAMLIALQKHVSEDNETREFRADELFSIHIGKTPPRKQHEWFSTERAENVIWMSIKDMGKSGAYLIDSSEYLTKKAVKQFNIKTCKPGSILLSFKLTIGRVGIVASEMVMNEAIACFTSDDGSKLSYLYPLLLGYDYSKLGNTSSIAAAVNSKTIKAMPLRMPNDGVLDDYYQLTRPIYDLLLSNTIESAKLEDARNALLPKLVSGEINVSEVGLITPPNNHLCGN